MRLDEQPKESGEAEELLQQVADTALRKSGVFLAVNRISKLDAVKAAPSIRSDCCSFAADELSWGSDQCGNKVLPDCLSDGFLRFTKTPYRQHDSNPTASADLLLSYCRTGCHKPR